MSRREARALLLTFARRGEEEAIREAMGTLRQALPAARIEAIGTPVSAPVLRALGVAEVIVYGEGQGAREIVRQARARKPELVGIVYWGPGLSGHLKLEGLALLSRAGRIYRFVPGARARQIGRFRLAFSVCGKVARALACAAAAGMMCAVALCCLRLRQMLAGGHRAGRA